MLDILGIKLEKKVLTKENIEIYQKWNEAKANKDFASADKYRAILIADNVL